MPEIPSVAEHLFLSKNHKLKDIGLELTQNLLLFLAVMAQQVQTEKLIMVLVIQLLRSTWV